MTGDTADPLEGLLDGPDPLEALLRDLGGLEAVMGRGWHHSETCGAFARSTGKPCQAPPRPNGRCRRHGGASTGPRTLEGKARIAEANRRRWAASRAANLASASDTSPASPRAVQRGAAASSRSRVTRTANT